MAKPKSQDKFDNAVKKLAGKLLFIFIILKLNGAGIIGNWSWWFIMSPLIIGTFIICVRDPLGKKNIN